MVSKLLPISAGGFLPKKIKQKTPRPGRAQSSQKIWQSKTLLASIVDSSEDAIIGKTLDGIITSWNQGARRIYGYSAQEVIGKPISILIPTDRSDEIPEILKKIARGERIQHFESVRVAKDGRRLRVSLSVSPIRDPTGNIIGASAIARDLTPLDRTRQALQESESRAHALFQAATQGILVVAPNGRILMANPATEKLFGYTVAELEGESVERLLPERFRTGHAAHREHFFRNPQTRAMGLGIDLHAHRKNGTEFYAEISLTYIPSPQGTLAVAFVTDISKRRTDEQAIRQQGHDLRMLAGKLMTAQDDERRRISRDLHDDLSQTLAYLAIDLGKLANRPSAVELTADVRSLQRRAAEAAETVRRISHELHPSILDDIGLAAALEQYCEEFQARSGIVAHFTSKNVPESVGPDVSSSIYHIAQECLRNVAKHSKAEEVFVEIEAVNDVLRLSVKDHGVGLMARPSQPRSGIGIVTIQERAHLVNGRVSIQSKSGEGTEVNVEVPLPATA
jgi:PAS domain S-box-containing protein